jgi:hypothetical protein
MFVSLLLHPPLTFVTKVVLRKCFAKQHHCNIYEDEGRRFPIRSVEMRIGEHDKSQYLELSKNRPHSCGVDVEDVHPALLLGKADLHLDLQAAGPQQRLVNHVLSVRHACRSINHCTRVSNSGTLVSQPGDLPS